MALIEKPESSNFLSQTIEALYSPKPEYTLDDVSYHCTREDCWIILYDRVYDVTNFLDRHPGTDVVLMEEAGRDCTIAFRGHSLDAIKMLKEFEIGVLVPHQRIYRTPGRIRTSESMPE